MGFVLSCGRYPELEKQFTADFSKWMSSRGNPLLETCLVVVPTSALRRRLLGLLLEAGNDSLSGVRIVSLNGLVQEIVFDSLQEPFQTMDDPVYLTLLLQSVARNKHLKRFESYRAARGVLSTIRDMVDGLLTPDLLSNLLDQAREDREIRDRIGNFNDLAQLLILYSEFDRVLKDERMVNVQFASALATGMTSSWAQNRNVNALFLYGFYDATPSQFELMEILSRDIFRMGEVHVYFPFCVDSNSRVEHPAQFAQEYFERIQSLKAALGGESRDCASPPLRGASGGLEEFLFQVCTEIPSDAHLEIFNCGSPYEEAWSVSKRILDLVLNNGVTFDQICVLSRSKEPSQDLFRRVFEENRIPCRSKAQCTLAGTPAGQFLFLLLRARQSNLNHNLVFELLCSPFLKQPLSHPGLVRQLLEIVFITNSDDWHRLKPLIDETKKLPEIFEIEEDDWRIEHYRKAASYLIELKDAIEQIPQRATLSVYAASVSDVLQKVGIQDRFHEAGGFDLELLLERLTDLSLNEPFSLNEFVDIFGDYLKTTLCADMTQVSDSGVTIADVMSLRGDRFDYVFLTGLNHDVFPIRITEDPFLPDAVRHAIRQSTGAGPHSKRAYLLNQESQNSGDEEVLLLALALRSANQKLFLSYQRADGDGRKKAASIFIEEILRIVSASNQKEIVVEHVPRQLNQRLAGQYLPTPEECSRLTVAFSMSDVTTRFYGLQPEYAGSTLAFGELLSSMEREESAMIDGCMENPQDFWQQHVQGNLRYSYSRMQAYVKCPFSFFADRILRLESSPFQPTPVMHDLTPLVTGRISESVVKEALTKLKKGGGISMEQSVEQAAAKIRRKYSSYLPRILMDFYLTKFTSAARALLEFLQAEGYDFSFVELPGRKYLADVPLLPNLTIYGIPDLVFLGQKRLIGEMKWGSAATMETADAMFKRGEFQFCFYPVIEQHSRQLLESFDFQYFRLNVFAEIGSPRSLEQQLRLLGAPVDIDNTLRIFGNAPSSEDIARNLEKLKEVGGFLLNAEFRILEDPGDYYTPCTSCRFTLICRRTHSATLLRTKKESMDDDTSSDFL